MGSLSSDMGDLYVGVAYNVFSKSTIVWPYPPVRIPWEKLTMVCGSGSRAVLPDSEFLQICFKPLITLITLEHSIISSSGLIDNSGVSFSMSDGFEY